MLYKIPIVGFLGWVKYTCKAFPQTWHGSTFQSEACIGQLIVYTEIDAALLTIGRRVTKFHIPVQGRHFQKGSVYDLKFNTVPLTILFSYIGAELVFWQSRRDTLHLKIHALLQALEVCYSDLAHTQHLLIPN